MVEIKTDNPEVEKCLRKIIDKAEQAGSFFADDMTISCLDNYMAVYASASRHGDNFIMSLPEEALPPLGSFTYALNGDDLYIASHKDDELKSSQIELMELMLELFNLTGKIKDFRQTSPWIYFQNYPKLRDHILKGRNAKTVHNLLFQKDYMNDEQLIKTFFKSRQLGFKATPDSPGKPVIMPIIDCLNHHFLSTPFMREDKNDRHSLAIKVSNSIPGSDECFVRYGPYDAMDTLVNYGFSDEGNMSFFTRSVITEINFSDFGAGTLLINGHTVSNMPPKSPPELSDIPFFQPSMVSHNGDQLEISHILIPGPRNPRALHRVLAFLIKGGIKPQATQKELIDMIKFAEDTIIDTNVEYYNTLGNLLDQLGADLQDHPVTLATRNAIETQLGKINSYKDMQATANLLRA